jgi:DNA repair protein RadA/Sms
MGFCPQCRLAEPLVEERSKPRVTTGTSPVPIPLAEAGGNAPTRVPVGIGEIDRVLGGGLVPGAVLLLGGEPGVGKSTLVLQAAAALTASGRRVLIASAEESIDQVGLRAQRLGVPGGPLYLLAEDDVDRILAAADEMTPDLIVIDSVQTVSAAEVGSAPGATTQVRECAARVIRFAKERGVAAVLVGHVTKDGAIAGPKTLEHMVDVVLYLEGEGDRGLRALRGWKNRFGPTHVAGLFEMSQDGLVEVSDPSRAFLAEWESSVPGTVVFPTIDGRRPVLVEVQALVAPGEFTPSRRSARGIDPVRLHQLLAVLDRHAGVGFPQRDVYVGVVGGLTLTDPGIDLPVALALVSSLQDVPLGPMAAWGEVGLTGEVRQVPLATRRREEAERVGATVMAPSNGTRLRLSEALERAGLGIGSRALTGRI